MISGRIFVAAVIVGALGLTCSDQGKPTSPVSSTLSSPSLAKKAMDTTIVTQGHVKRDLQYCDDGRIAVGRIGPYGSLDHYLAQSGKRIGFNQTIGTPGSLRRTYGFNSANITDVQLTEYDTAGYAPESLMVAISKTNPGGSIDACPGAVEFYVDEPMTSQGYSIQDLVDMANYVHQRGKKFGVGEQGHMLFFGGQMQADFNQYVVPLLDFITYTNTGTGVTIHPTQTNATHGHT